MHDIAPLPSLRAVPDDGQETAAGPARSRGRARGRPAGIGLAALGRTIGIGVADPLLARAALAIELAVALTIIGTALFGSQALSERAFRLLRWVANRPEPAGPGTPAAEITSSSPHP